jgi:hypothetical protein
MDSGISVGVVTGPRDGKLRKRVSIRRRGGGGTGFFLKASKPSLEPTQPSVEGKAAES